MTHVSQRTHHVEHGKNDVKDSRFARSSMADAHAYNHTMQSATSHKHKDNGIMINAMSVDVEEWFQVGAFENTFTKNQWPDLESRVAMQCEQILALFAKFDVKATFFTLGWVAERHPEMIRKIVDQGHEIASHGWDHDRVFTLSAGQFARDIDRARKAIEDAAGVAVKGYRAPSFSIDQRTPWAHEILQEKGYLYSSSVAPIAHDHYGWPDAPRFAYHPIKGHDFLEIPVTTVQMFGRNFGAGGGGFFRILPWQFFQFALNRVNGTDKQSAIFYFHPWEIDPDQPYIKHAPMRSKLRHYTKLDKMQGKLEKLLTAYHWGRMDDVFCTPDKRITPLPLVTQEAV